MWTVHDRRWERNRFCTYLPNEKRAVPKAIYRISRSDFKRLIKPNHLLVVKKRPFTHVVGFEVALKSLESLNFIAKAHLAK